MASTRKSYHQGFVLPLALTASLLAMLATWHQHTLKVRSPIEATHGQAAAWAGEQARSRHCLPASVDIEVDSEGFAPVTGSSGPWFATLRCNQTPRIYWRLAAILIVPWAVMTLLARLWFRAGD